MTVTQQTEALARQRETLRRRGICVVIPTYNNVSTVETVVRSTLEQCADVIVVSDGSTDGTTALVSRISGATLLTHTRNLGKGRAIATGFREARRRGFAYAITLDADGQHYPRDIAALLRANRAAPGALIVGRRRLEGKVRSGGSKFANGFSNFWFFVQTGRWLADTQTGFRLYPLRHIHGLWLLTSRYEAELELLVFAAWHSVGIESVDVDVYYPPRQERVSHFRPVADFARITVLNTVLCLGAVVYGLPLRLCRCVARLLRTLYALTTVMTSAFLIVTPLVWLYVHLGPMTERKQWRIHRLIQWLARFIMIWHGIPGVRFRHRVAEGVDWGQPHVVVCNHQSHLDLVCQLIFTPRLVFLTNDWVWRNPMYGFLIRHAEYYPVAEGIDALLPRLRSLAERGYSIAIFPEGTRSLRIGRFHQGAFHVARELGLPILPMVLYGPGRVLRKKAHSLRKGDIYIEVGAPISRSELDAMGTPRQQASELRRRYVERYAAIADRIEQNA